LDGCAKKEQSEKYCEIAEILKALAHPLRLCIVQGLEVYYCIYDDRIKNLVKLFFE
jgi:hypothetical protein